MMYGHMNVKFLNVFVQESPQPWFNMDILVSGLRHILNVTNNRTYGEGKSFIATALYLKIIKNYNPYVGIKSGRETRF